MDFQIAVLLAQDALTNGAIYALMALALVLVFTVTRIIFIPQGEFLAFGALTLANLQIGKTPGIIWLLLGLGALTFLFDAAVVLRDVRVRRPLLSALWNSGRSTSRNSGRSVPWNLGRSALWNLVLPACAAALAFWLAPRHPPLAVQLLLTGLLIVPMGPMLYRVAYQPVAEAPVLVLLIVSMAAHLALSGLGLYFFGAEGSRTPAFSGGALELGWLRVSGQSLWVYASSVVLMGGLYAFFGRTLYGKALRATAGNRIGARLSGISPIFAGKVCFLLAAVIGVLSGFLIGPITTIYYDTGFLVGLKGFVGAIIGGLVGYPLAAAGALLVGLLESYASFYASAYKEVIVFTLIIPVLLWRSLASPSGDDE